MKKDRTALKSMFAMNALSLVPVLIVFAFFYLLEGISITGLKG